ncbi:twin-arginine translocase TatA/TatE family subunit [Qipengyuania sp. MTN3-11]|uniref:twin-arginine translocase TatA/TatE family subunit n=1 Tax=Qipengyuania sp. MTN3-11 TaxID=3056557 RepID=UPI0036F2EC94
MSLGPWQLVIIAILVLVLFGRGRISEMMGDFGKGISSFKKGMKEEEEGVSKPAPRLEGPSHEAKPAGEVASDPRPAEKTETPS